MKKNLYSLIGIALFLCLCFCSKANITTGDQPQTTAFKTKSACFTDAAYTWNIVITESSTANFYTCTGTVNVDGTEWTVYGSGIFPGRTGSVLLHASNPNPDNCAGFYVDSFTYNGTATVTGSGSTLAYSGSGVWVSYCSGAVYLTGGWSASGPCADNFKPHSNDAGPARTGNPTFKVIISPNPLKSSSTLTFNLVKDSKVSITVYNSRMQPVKQIVNRTELAGKHSYIIDGSSLTSGVYHVVTIINGKPHFSSLQVVK